MTRDDLNKLLTASPFTPLEVRTSDGRSHQITHPECALLGKTKLVLLIDGDEFVILSLLHIAGVSMAA
jgi:hypothetical protein